MLQPTVNGVGINDAGYSIGKGRKCPYYRAWYSMLQRCYSQNCLNNRPTYIGCSVSPEWHLFSTFRTWMEKQDWQDKVLDKDIRIVGNKQYGPDACLFVTQKINCLFNTQRNRKGEYPVGVAKHNNKFRVTVSQYKKTQYVGLYATIDEAAVAYRNAKAAVIVEHAQNEPCSVTRVALLKAAQEYKEGIR